MLSKEGFLGRFKAGTGHEAKSQRSSLPKDVAAALKAQFSSLAGRDLSPYTCEQEKSAQQGAKFDIRIYDETGALRYEGRNFGSAQGFSFWKAGG